MVSSTTKVYRLGTTKAAQFSKRRTFRRVTHGSVTFWANGRMAYIFHSVEVNNFGARGE